MSNPFFFFKFTVLFRNSTLKDYNYGLIIKRKLKEVELKISTGPVNVFIINIDPLGRTFSHRLCLLNDILYIIKYGLNTYFPLDDVKIFSKHY